MVLGAAEIQPNQDFAAVEQFKAEELQHSHVMEMVSAFTDVYGPRLTNTPNLRHAAEFAEKTLDSWGLANIHEEKWGPYGRGWTNELTAVREVSPGNSPLIAYPKPWTTGTNGPITAEVVYARIEKNEDFGAFHGKLKGKIVMTAPPRAVEPHFAPEARRWTDQELETLAQSPAPAPVPSDADRKRVRTQRKFNQKLQKFITDEGAVAWLEPSALDDGTVVVTGGGSRMPNDPPVVARLAVGIEQYDRIARLIEKQIPVRLEVNVSNRFYDDDLNSFNLIAEIPGTDKSDEVVMLGAHLDSWTAATGATDNAAGCAVILEAMRILKSSGLPMRRTVRMALWTGEEEGLLGSRAYMRQHFAEREKMRLLSEHAKLSGYFNVDNGTGKIRGVYLQGNDDVRPIFAKWMEPLRDMGMTTLAPRSLADTDHASFDEVGLSGFQFIQDPIDYIPRTHHSNMDTLDRIQEQDLRQMAVIVASFASMAANADQELPRKPLPKR